MPVHTSDLLKRLIDEVPKDTVDLDWLLGHLQKRAFGLLLLILAIAIIIPGLGVVASFAMVFPAVEMLLGRDRPTLPHFLTKRPFAAQRFTKWAARALPVLRAIERVSRSRWHTPAAATKRTLGLLVLLLVLSGIWPLPLINVVPAITIAVLAIALLQEDGLLLAVAFSVGILSLLAFGLLVWKSADALEHLFSS
ncbi:exopolysaccharide biosynthesis protein [Bradyrhizobium sp. dw_411]|uniref:exopolysaccharide biosynthesis protein n=1 Tax=Bradyrhizobium sp. dw_411 TaxID=2720082 RepID=UPI001BD0A3F9|nr:exopolysaccharide biosynthesis protein [Bradyrhizobium sp. dw_411]